MYFTVGAHLPLPVLQAGLTVDIVLFRLTPPLRPGVVELAKTPVSSVFPRLTGAESGLHGDVVKHPVPTSLNLSFTTFSVLGGSKYPPAVMPHI